MSLLDKFKIEPTPAVYRPPILSLFGKGSIAVPEQVQIVDKPRFGKAPVGHSKDLSRILALDRRSSPTKEVIAEMTAKFSRPNPKCKCQELGALTCVKELFYVQAWCLREAPLAGGILGPIGVGHGKTLLDMLMPMAFEDCQRAVLLIPPNLRAQFAREWEIYGQHWNLPNLAGGRWNVPGRPTLTVLAFSELSREKAAVALQKLKPDLMIVDEAHNLRNHDATRTGRVLRYFKENPQTRLVCWSGTLTSRSITDYAHLSQMALGEGSPVPNHWPTVEEWACAIDPVPKSGFPSPIGALRTLCNLGEDVRDGFRRRLKDTLGVVSTEESALGTALTFSERKPPEVPQAVKEALEKLRGPNGADYLNRKGEIEADLRGGKHGDWKRPDGEEFVDALAVARCARELACGFYYRWRFPRGEPDDLIEDWLLARKEWHKELRDRLKFRRDQMDSPLLCAKAAIRYYDGYSGDLPTWKAITWPKWREVRELVKPETEAVWIDTFLAEDAANWATQNTGIVWFDQLAFGLKVAEISGLNFYGGGLEASEQIGKETGKKSIVCSIRAHGTGKNLQRFSDQLVANPPSDGATWEQMIGRTHRTGQQADEVKVNVYRHTEEMSDAFDKARQYAKYIEQTMGTRQKLLQGTVEWVRSHTLFTRSQK